MMGEISGGPLRRMGKSLRPITPWGRGEGEGGKQVSRQVETKEYFGGHDFVLVLLNTNPSVKTIGIQEQPELCFVETESVLGLVNTNPTP